MNRSHLAATLAICLAISLSACQTPGSDSASNLGGAVGTIIGVLPTSVQDKVKQGCGWEEPLVNIAAIIAKFKPGKFSSKEAFIASVANGICDVVNAAPAPTAAVSLFARASKPLAYRGVVLDGKFVRKQ